MAYCSPAIQQQLGGPLSTVTVVQIAPTADIDLELQDQDHQDLVSQDRTPSPASCLPPIGGGANGQTPLTLDFSNLSVWAPPCPDEGSQWSKAASWLRGIGKRQLAPDVQKQILFNTSGQVCPGEVLALMGPSGSGKTTLLTVLGGRSAMKYQGQVSINRAPFTKASRRRVGFVLQDDVLYESLTVKETLTYAALLRLPASMSRQDKLQRVECVIDALGLRKSTDTVIGDYLHRGVSGGERKRVSIGHELLTNPAILLLDEPTSGLDATTALHLITLLQDLAAGGRAIDTTIHQPSSRLYQKLDRLMLLAEGHVMYYGRAADVLGWFQQFGYTIPLGVSTADYILDISMGEAGYDSSGTTGSAAVKELYTVLESCSLQAKQQDSRHSPEQKQKSSAIVSHGSLLGTVGSYCPGKAQGGADFSVAASDIDIIKQDSSSSAALTSDVSGSGSGSCDLEVSLDITNISKQIYQSDSDPEAAAAAGRAVVGLSAAKSSSSSSMDCDQAHYWDQLRVLTQRAGRVQRFEQITGHHFFQLFAVAFITGVVWWQRGQQFTADADPHAVSDVLGLLFFMLLFPSMRAMSRAVHAFPDDHRMLLKERPSGMYKLSAYYLAKMAADLPTELLNVVLYTVVAYWFGGLRHTAAAFVGLLLLMALVTAVAESWGLLIGVVFMDPKNAQTVSKVIILTFLVIGGYYVHNIPSWVSWIRYISFLYWGYSLLIKTQFSGLSTLGCDPKSGSSCTPTQDTKSSFGTDPSAPAYPEVLILLGMLVVLRLVIYCVLRAKTNVVQRAVG